MTRITLIFLLAATLIGCESMYQESSGIPRIRSQKQVDEYNATVSSEGEKLVCTKERPLGSNISQFICMTRNQQDRLAQQSQQTFQDVGRGAN